MATSKPIIFIVGLTASGKSGLAMKLAKEIGGEIICADSQTVRRGLDIGTAKPSKQDQEEVPHHLLDIIEPYEKFNVAQFKKLAVEAIDYVRKRNRIPIVVGGTGLYIDSLFYDYSFRDRQEIDTSELDNLSVAQLQERIKLNNYPMPENLQNPRHLIGTILRGGKNSQDLTPDNNSKIYGLKRDDETIKQRINDRVDLMFKTGFVEEVRTLLDRYGQPPKKLDAIGYPIVSRYIDGEITEEEAKGLFKQGDWQYARRQKSWFSRNRFIHWFDDAEQAFNQIIKDIDQN